MVIGDYNKKIYVREKQKERKQTSRLIENKMKVRK